MQFSPDKPLYHINLGVIFRDHDRIDDAITSFGRAIAINPGDARAHHHLGNALRRAGQLDEAIAAYREAVRLKPDYAMAYSNLGNMLRDRGAVDEAVEVLQTAVYIQPDYAVAYRNLGLALSDRRDLDSAMDHFRKSVAVAPDDPSNRSPLFAIAHREEYDEVAVDLEYRRWAARFADALPKFSHSQTPDRSPGDRLRIGYVSNFFVERADIHYLLPLLLQHDRSRFELFAYADVTSSDGFTDRCRSAVDHWHRTLGLSDQQLADLIYQHHIDVLIATQPSSRLLVLARRPAPVQMTWLFSASSSGLASINFRISDPHIDPPDADEIHFSEQTLRLPRTAWCYHPLQEEIPVGPLPAGQNGHITFGSLGRLGKVGDSVIQAWSAVLQETKNSRLYLMAPPGRARENLLSSFANFQINPNRIEFISHQPRHQYLQTYQRIDIVLDTFPYNGHTTSLDALWMGVPVITVAHRRPVGRVGASLLHNVGLPELIANRPEEMIQIAARLAGDLGALSLLRANLRQRLKASPLMDAAGFARDIEAAYLRAVVDMCVEKHKDHSST